MRVLVCGGRGYSDRARVFDELDALDRRKPIALIIEGGATGADRLARDWARRYHTAVVTFPADWQQNGKVAGFIRNQRMLDDGKPNLVLAFPGGNGTADMVRRAKRAGVPVQVVEDLSAFPLLRRGQIRRALEWSVEWFEDRFGYLRFVDNWHKARPISWLMCKLGRHDYEAVRVHVWLRATDLFCFYCEHRKRSYHSNEGRGIE